MKILLSVLAFLLVFKAYSQNYLISFSGYGASTTVSTVKVENLRSGESLSLNGNDILSLSLTTGISADESNSKPEILIYPNPTTDKSILQFFSPGEGDVVITLYDMTGRQIAQTRNYLETGLQEFSLSGINSGFYLISVKGNTYQYSRKLLCNSNSVGTISLMKINTYKTVVEKSQKADKKGVQTTVDMAYTPGDRLKFTGMSGIYSTVKTDIPISDKTITFNFIACTDGDNNNYPVVEIGTQIWMAENLKTTKYNDGNIIPLVADNTSWNILITPGVCWINNDPAYKDTYGALYNWYTVATGKLCPQGWRVSSNSDWSTLIAYLGGNSSSGGKLKEAGTVHWFSPNIGASNETGFTALPGAFRSDGGVFGPLGYSGYWWSSSGQSTGKAYYYIMKKNYSWAGSEYYYKCDGYSVRCVLNQAPAITTSAVTNFDRTTASVGGNVLSDGGAAVTERGIYWSTSPNTELTGTKLQIGSGTGSFLTIISGLNPSTSYYVKAYAINIIGTGFGNEVHFLTNPIIAPVITTTSVTSITQTTATIGGNVTDDGGSTVIDRGVYWGTSQNPVSTGTKLQIGSGTGPFLTIISGLNPNTPYYVRAYATNSIGTSFGTEIIFTSMQLSVPILSTINAFEIKQINAKSGGNVTSDGGKTVDARGVCWSISANPTITDNCTSDGTGSGFFSSNLTGLDPNTKYYVRAFATNSIGTAYGSQISFTTYKPDAVTDIDNNFYNTITIGTQKWLTENLKTTKYKNGDLIGTTTPATLDISGESAPKYQWAYDGNDSYVTDYGRLYTWYAATDIRGVCPTGWHIPTQTDFATLLDLLGGMVPTALKMVETVNNYWGTLPIPGTNETGFSARGAGYREANTFKNLAQNSFGYTIWWCNEEDSNTAYGHVGGISLMRDFEFWLSSKNKFFGASIRCLKD